jgi:hypothetical protein
VRKKDPTRRQLRDFAFIFTAFFLLVGVYPLVRHEQAHRWSLGIAAGLALLAVGWPDVLRKPHAVWMKVGMALGWLNSRVFLTLAYFLLFSPAAFLMRLIGKDPLNRRFDRALATYRIKRESRPASHMQHQF